MTTWSAASPHQGDPADIHPEQRPWSFTNLVRMKTAFNDGGFSLDVIEARPPLNKAKLGLSDRDEEIEYACELIRNMGKVGIPVWCPEWMPVLNWTRTSMAAPGRGGAMVTGFDNELMQKRAADRRRCRHRRTALG